MSGKIVKAALYLRVSTDQQSVAMQRAELEAAAARRDWQIIRVYEDAGFSGALSRDQRPGLKDLMKATSQGKYDVVMSWSVDRLGRSLTDLLRTLETIQSAGCELYLHQQGIDTSTAAGRMLFSLIGVFAEFERTMIGARVRAGLDRARAKGVRLGRAPVSRHIERSVKELLAVNMSSRAIASKLKLSHTTVDKLKKRFELEDDLNIKPPGVRPARHRET